MSGLVFILGVTMIGAVVAAIAMLSGSGLSRPGARSVSLPGDLRIRLLLALCGAALLGLVTRWPVAALAGGVGGYFARDLLAPPSLRQAPIERTEAIAEWTEQLRDTMAAAAGLQQAIAATAPLAPLPIWAEVSAFALRARREPMVPLLEELGEALADPTGDLVITALSLAAAGEAQDLGEVLSSLAGAARDDATMRRYVDASRSRTRTGVRIITAMTLLSLVALLVFGQGYLAPYDSAAGQGMLGLILGLFGAGIWSLSRMGAESAPPRLLGRPTP